MFPQKSHHAGGGEVFSSPLGRINLDLRRMWLLRKPLLGLWTSSSEAKQARPHRHLSPAQTAPGGGDTPPLSPVGARSSRPPPNWAGGRSLEAWVFFLAAFRLKRVGRKSPPAVLVQVGGGGEGGGVGRALGEPPKHRGAPAGPGEGHVGVRPFPVARGERRARGERIWARSFPALVESQPLDPALPLLGSRLGGARAGARGTKRTPKGTEKMIFASVRPCWISLAYFSFGLCINFPTFVPVGEPWAIRCPLRLLPSLQSNYSITWYGNGSDIPITKDNFSRIHQRGELLWFIPTYIEDSGFYHCTIDNSTRDSKELKVVENSDGLCFNEEATYPQKVVLGQNGNLACPDLNDFEDENTEFDLQWYKDCSPKLLDNKRFQTLGHSLFINNPSKKDEGMYICQAKYTYMGKQYNVSRAINLTILDPPPKVPVEIIYPNNNSIEIKLGSSVIIECNASRGFLRVSLFWDFGDEEPEDFKSTHIKYSEPLLGKMIWRSKFNISNVKYKDYRKYFCAVSSFGLKEQVVYVQLQPPAPNFQGYLIGGLASPLFVILAALFAYKFFKVDIVLRYRETCYSLHKEVSDGKLYDAYVLYPQKGTDCTYSSDIFVLDVLPEVLENQCGYKLFIFGRDDFPGQAVVNVVEENIKRSRRLIIVLVPNSSCCRLQSSTSVHEIAVYSALIRYGIKVILIELDKIKDDDSLPESIRYLKQKHGVLTWQGDFSVKSQMATTRFWKNVRYQMPANPNSPSLDLHPSMVTSNSYHRSEG
uniref:Interleukin-1 receptor type 1-like isoform X1 n=1 Tax=Pogona vitticeps TaxID=103695 RepID=A0A6J0V904_9SAUR